MKRILLVLLTLGLRSWVIGQTLTAPQAQGVWGGRILDISAIPIHPDSTRVFVSTESSNTAFYADVYHGSPSRFGIFRPVINMGYRDNYGDNINWIQAHESSGRLFFISEGRLLSTHPKTNGVSTHFSFGVSSFLIKGDSIFIVQGRNFHWGTLSGTGAYSGHSSSPISLTTFTTPPIIVIDPVTDSVYLFSEGYSPQLFVLDDTYKNLMFSTGYRAVGLSGFLTTTEWRTFGIAPDGRFFVAGADFNPGPMPNANMVGYSDDQGASWSFHSMNLPGPPGGATGPNFDFAGDASSYTVYLSDAYNDHNGEATHWNLFGVPGGTNRFNVSNDGAVLRDPVADSVVYFTTNHGLGYSTDFGSTVWGFNKGITAVQVFDIDMNSDFKTAWVASKSGIRKVTNFKSGTPLWYWTQFPLGDGSPYYSADMANNDTDKVFVGNSRIYRTRDGGANWEQVFEPENAPYNYPRIGTEVQAIEVCPYDTAIVMAAYYVREGSEGGLFVSHDGGENWSQILISSSSVGSDINLYDVLFTIEGSDTVAYVAAEFVSSTPGESVYRVVKSGTNWAAAQDMGVSGTSTATAYSFTVTDMDVSRTGDSVFACGFDPSSNSPIVLMKSYSGTGLWTPLDFSGLGSALGFNATAVTLGLDTLYCAVDEEIMIYPFASATWSSAYTYPTGTRINFLYYDELLVGTSHGLYAQYGELATEVGHIWVGNEISVYPNPFGSSLCIELDQPVRGQVFAEIVDLSGRCIFAKQLFASDGKIYFLRPEGIDRGMYLLRIHSDEKVHYSGTIIKN